MRGKFGTRMIHGIVSAVLVCFFLLHGVLGSASMTLGFSSPLKALVWAGVALVAVHVALCAVVSRQMLNDQQRPPSDRKINHLKLKWATGGVLLFAAALHVAYSLVLGKPAVTTGFSGFLAMLLLIAALAAHICVGSKSLLKDLNIDRKHRSALRAAVVAFAVLFGLAMISRL